MRAIVNTHSIDLSGKFAVGFKENQDRLPTLYWFSKLHKRLYKSRFIVNSSSYMTTILSKLLTMPYCCQKKKKKKKNNNIGLDTMTLFTKGTDNYFWSIKNSNEILNKFKFKKFKASELSTYDFSTMYITLPHHPIKDKLLDLINQRLIG